MSEEAKWVGTKTINGKNYDILELGYFPQSLKTKEVRLGGRWYLHESVYCKVGSKRNGKKIRGKYSCKKEYPCRIGSDGYLYMKIRAYLNNCARIFIYK